MNASEEDSKVRSVVVKPCVIRGRQWCHTNEELVDTRPHPCLVPVFQVQDPHVVECSVLDMTPEGNDGRVVGSMITCNHSSASSGWRPSQLSCLDLQPLINCRIILPRILKIEGRVIHVVKFILNFATRTLLFLRPCNVGVEEGGVHSGVYHRFAYRHPLDSCACGGCRCR